MSAPNTRPRTAAAARPVQVGTADVVDRLARLRELIPAMARDLATARRDAISLRAENESLHRRIAQLEATLEQLPPPDNATPRHTHTPR